jgi:hypothetical protein
MAKQPGKDAMKHPNILGEVNDEQWRICWLDKKERNDRAGSDKLPEPSLYQTPGKQKQELVSTLKT